MRKYRLASGEMSREDRIRDPLKWKGLRTRFRTILNAPSKFKYRTDLLRHGPALLVRLRKGDIKEMETLIQERIGSEFEGFAIRVM